MEELRSSEIRFVIVTESMQIGGHAATSAIEDNVNDNETGED